MVLIYAYGSGLGHLTRVTAFLNDQNYDPKDCLILTNSIYTKEFPAKFRFDVKPKDFFRKAGALNEYIQYLYHNQDLIEIVVDVFPNGFYGELSDLNLPIKKSLLARILSDAYFERYPKPFQFDTVYSLEDGIGFLKDSQPLHLSISPTYQRIQTPPNQPYFLVLHSQPISEVLNLYRYAQMLRKEEIIIIQSFTSLNAELIAPCDSLIVQQWADLNLIEHANKIFSACGFNSLKLLEPFKENCLFVPFPRKYDDQFLRKKLY